MNCTCKKYRAVITLVFMMVVAGSCAIPTKMQVKMQRKRTILGLGDSITEGGADFYSYLFPLDSLLKQRGYAMEFTGPRLSVQGGDSIRHAGFSGKTAEFIAKSIDSIYSAFPADIVLLHAGHNHFAEESPIAGIVQAQRKIIETIKRKNKNAIILVAAVITSGKLPKYTYIPALDSAIRDMTGAFHDRSIVFVDQQAHWNWELHTIQDKVHPNREGALVIASNWLNAIQTSLSKQH